MTEETIMEFMHAESAFPMTWAQRKAALIAKAVERHGKAYPRGNDNPWGGYQPAAEGAEYDFTESVHGWLSIWYLTMRSNQYSLHSIGEAWENGQVSYKGSW